MLANAAESIGKLVAEGKSNADIVAAAPTAQLDGQWGKGFMKPPRFVEMVAEDLRKNR
jgi:hypothetical protein